MEVLCNFQKLKPPKFEGGPDPLVYEDWIRKIEDLLEVMECPPQFKVRLASHQFEKEANFWWATFQTPSWTTSTNVGVVQGLIG